MVLGFAQLIGRDRLGDELLGLGEADFDGFAEAVAVDAGGDGEDAGIGEVAVAGGDGVGEAAALADFAEEAGRHAGAEDIVEDDGGCSDPGRRGRR
ncbi:hypothetical protein O0235_09260 [Tepidiforma flava]|uniref:Uncharacterized protein n=1 Tax=Tepidiforma flava TaxID=3004094 RepID=A0ABY7M2U8_9CHLR|nr:hypothetical protein [Tepidiforma flava]WBL34981.1 hypothetical protein O0235_09260 [Tepidiforma flava]